MANRLMEGWKNIVLPVGWTNRALETAIPDSFWNTVAGNAAGGTAPFYVDRTATGGWLWFQMQAQSQYGLRFGISRLLTSIVSAVTATTVLFGGFRVKLPGTAVMCPDVLLCIFDRQAIGNFQNLFSYSMLPQPTVVDGEYFIEWSIDMTTNSFRYRVDGGPVGVIALTAGMVSILTSNRGVICMGSISDRPVSTAGLTWSLKIKDVYVNEKTADGINSGWTGPISLVPVYVADATTDWSVAGAADVKTAFNKPMELAADVATPLVTSDPVKNVLEAKLTIDEVVGNVLAVSVFSTAKRPGGSAANLKASAVTGTTEVAGAGMALAATMRHNALIYSGDKTPDGKPWSRANIQAMKFKLTATNT